MSTPVDQINGTVFLKQSQVMWHLQSENYLFYFLSKFEGQNKSKVTMYRFRKIDGDHKYFSIRHVPGRVICGHTSINEKLTLSMGTSQGNFIQVIIPLQQQPQSRSIQQINGIFSQKVHKLKISVRAIVSVCLVKNEFWGCLTQDNQISLLQQGAIRCVLRAHTMACDRALRMKALNEFIYACSEFGMLMVWKLRQLKQRKQFYIRPQTIIMPYTESKLMDCQLFGECIALVYEDGMFILVSPDIGPLIHSSDDKVFKNGYFINLIKIKLSLTPILCCSFHLKDQCIFIATMFKEIVQIVKCSWKGLTPTTTTTKYFVPQITQIRSIVVSQELKYIFLRGEDKFMIAFNNLLE